MPRALPRAVAALAGLLITAPALALTPSHAVATKHHRADDSTPLQVSISGLTPGAIPGRGSITVSGTVTNTDDTVWLDVGIYPFVSTTPITSQDDLEAAAETPADAEVGQRILAEGDYERVDRIEPGTSVPYTLTIPRADLTALGVGAAGVYWFGVHALGSGPDGSDTVADGRARTFLPLLPTGATTVPATVVVPVRARVDRASDGSIDNIARWTKLLRPGGRLARLADLATTPSAHDLSWLVDPSVLAAVRQLADGNPVRPLLSEDDGTGEGDGESASPSASTEPDPDDGDTPDEETQLLSIMAADWWTRMSTSLRGADLLALPYGDLDLTGAAANNPGSYDLARTRSQENLSAWALSGTPVNAPADGTLDTGASDLLAAVAPTTPVIVSDTALPGDPTSPVAELGDLRLAAIDSDASSGGPGPDAPLAATALRQRVLAEAAVRSLAGDTDPLLVAVPDQWSVADATQLAAGLRQPWLLPQSLSTDLVGTVPGTVDHLIQPTEGSPVGRRSFEAATSLVRAGRSLQRVLVGNTEVANATLDESLTTVSYARRGATSQPAAASAAEINATLGQIEIRAPRAVTLSGSTGPFAVTVVNPLTEPVAVTLRVVSDPGITMEQPEPVQIEGKSSATIPMKASDAHVGVHNVQLLLTDSAGARFGTPVSVPVRASQVSNIIWVFLGVGCALLFGAIGARLFRRSRARRG